MFCTYEFCLNFFHQQKAKYKNVLTVATTVFCVFIDGILLFTEINTVQQMRMNKCETETRPFLLISLGFACRILCIIHMNEIMFINYYLIRFSIHIIPAIQFNISKLKLDLAHLMHQLGCTSSDNISRRIRNHSFYCLVGKNHSALFTF